MSRNTGNGRLAAELDGGRGPSLFPHVEALPPFGRLVDASSLLDDPLLRSLIESRPVQRLRRIGFFGAVDRIRSRNRHNRYDHSVGVARLALLYARERHLSQRDTRLLAVSGLLHDVGHGPLSHTLEPVFKGRFGISHHKAGSQIIRGESPLGREIPEVLARYRLDPDEVVAMIDGTHHGGHAFLFSSPINLDTIEGITRCRSFFLKGSSVLVSAEAIVHAIAESDTPPTQLLDSFWLLKDQMYHFVIHHRMGLVYDGLAQAMVAQGIDGFKSTDFLKDDEQLRRSKPRLFDILDWARTSPDTLRKALPDSILSHEITAPTRRFECNTLMALKGSSDLVSRYVQTKTFRRVPIDDLLPAENPTKWPNHVIQEEFSMRASAAPIAASRTCGRRPWSDLAMPGGS